MCWIFGVCAVWSFWSRSREYELAYEQEANRHQEKMKEIQLKFEQEANRHQEESEKIRNSHIEEMRKLDIALMKQYQDFLEKVLPLAKESNTRLNEEAKAFTEMVLKHDADLVNRVLDIINQSAQARQATLTEFTKNVATADAILKFANMKASAQNWYTDFVFRMVKLYLADINDNYTSLLGVIDKILEADNELKAAVTRQLNSTREAMNRISDRIAEVAASFPRNSPPAAPFAIFSAAPPLFIPVFIPAKSGQKPTMLRDGSNVSDGSSDEHADAHQVVNLIQKQILGAWNTNKMQAITSLHKSLL